MTVLPSALGDSETIFAKRITNTKNGHNNRKIRRVRHERGRRRSWTSVES